MKGIFRKITSMLVTVAMTVQGAYMPTVAEIDTGYVTAQENTDIEESASEESAETVWAEPVPEWYTDYYYQLDDVNNEIILYESYYLKGNIVVPGSAVIDGKNYTVVIDSEESSIWSVNENDITGIKIGEGVRFRNNSCANLFCGIPDLETVVFENPDTSYVTDMKYMFSGCQNIRNVELSGLDTSKVTDMSYMFYNCLSLQEVDLRGLDTSSVTNMSNMFMDCATMCSLNLYGIDMSNVSEATGMLYGLDGLNVLDMRVQGFSFSEQFYLPCVYMMALPETLRNNIFVDAAKIYYTGDKQKWDSYLISTPSADIEYEYTALLPEISSEWNECPEDWYEDYIYETDNINKKIIITGTKGTLSGNIVISGKARIGDEEYKVEIKERPWNYNEEKRISGVKFIDGVICDCEKLLANLYNLERADISGLTGTLKNLFYYDHKLRKVELTGLDMQNVSDVSGLFFGCYSLSKLDLSSMDTKNVTDMSRMFEDCYELTQIDVSGFDTSNVTDMSSMFMNCHHLKNPDVSGFNTSNVTSMELMFYDCYNLTVLNLAGFDTAKVTSTESMFAGCKKIKSLDLRGFNTSNVESMSLMFYECNKLEFLDISKFDTSKVKDMHSMFAECWNLKSIDLSSFDTSNVTDMRNMFYICGIRSIDLSGFDTSNVVDMSWMFKECSLDELDVSGFDTSNVTDMSYMFSGVYLDYLDLSGFNTVKVENMENMFEYSEINKIEIRSFDIKDDYVIYEILVGCQNKALYLPVSWKSYDFDECEILKKIYYAGSEEQWNAINNTVPEGVEIIYNYTEPASNMRSLLKPRNVEFDNDTGEVSFTLEKDARYTLNSMCYAKGYHYGEVDFMSGETKDLEKKDGKYFFNLFKDGYVYGFGPEGHYTIYLYIYEGSKYRGGATDEQHTVIEVNYRHTGRELHAPTVEWDKDEFGRLNVTSDEALGWVWFQVYKNDKVVNSVMGPSHYTRLQSFIDSDVNEDRYYVMIYPYSGNLLEYDPYKGGYIRSSDLKYVPSGIDISDTAVAEGAAVEPSVTVMPAGNKCNYVLSSNSAENIEINGKSVKGKKAGRTTVTAYYMGLTDTAEICVKYAVPAAVYKDGKLTGLTANGIYKIEDVQLTADSSGAIDVKDEWKGKKISIIRIYEGDEKLNSDAQELEIEADAPVIPKPDTNDSYKPGDGIKISLEEGSVSYNAASGKYEAVYTGAAITPAVRVTNNGLPLTEGVEYTVKYRDNKDQGEAKVVVKGKNIFKGEESIGFTIRKKDISESDVYAGSIYKVEGAEADPVLVYNGIILKKDKDYSLKENGSVVTLTGMNNFTGIKEVPVTVVADNKELKQLTISARVTVKSKVYNAKAQTLEAGKEIEVKAGDTVLSPADYVITYSDNTNAGKVNVAVAGIGKYTGAVTKSFKITPYKEANIKASLPSGKTYTYEKAGVTPEVIVSSDLEELKEGRDYKISYSNNKKKGTKAKAKLTFLGNYKGAKYNGDDLKYTIVEQNIADAEVYAGEMIFTKEKKYKPSVVMIDKNGNIIPKTEYTLSSPDSRMSSAGMLDAELKGKDKNYTGNRKISVSVNAAEGRIDISKSKIVINTDKKKQAYTGEEIKLEPGRDFSIKISKDLTIDKADEISQNFDIVYADNINKGTAAVILISKPGSKYAGLISGKFGIVTGKMKTK